MTHQHNQLLERVNDYYALVTAVDQELAVLRKAFVNANHVTSALAQPTCTRFRGKIGDKVEQSARLIERVTALEPTEDALPVSITVLAPLVDAHQAIVDETYILIRNSSNSAKTYRNRVTDALNTWLKEHDIDF